jgi:hypothetical protein
MRASKLGGPMIAPFAISILRDDRPTCYRCGFRICMNAHLCMKREGKGRSCSSTRHICSSCRLLRTPLVPRKLAWNIARR